MARYSHTIAVDVAFGGASVGAQTNNFAFSANALEGNPGFTDTPVLCGPIVFQNTGTANPGPMAQCVLTIDSVSADMKFWWVTSQSQTVTVYYEAMGAQS